MLVDRERAYVWCEHPGCCAQRYPGKRWCHRHWMRRLNIIAGATILAILALLWVLETFGGLG